MSIKDRLKALEAKLKPPKYIFFKTVDDYPIDRFDLIWRTEPFVRDESETEADFIERCRAWANANYRKGGGIPAMFLHYPFF